MRRRREEVEMNKRDQADLKWTIIMTATFTFVAALIIISLKYGWIG